MLTLNVLLKYTNLDVTFFCYKDAHLRFKMLSMINSFFYSFIQMIYSVIRIFPSVPWSERATKNCLGFRYFITLYLMNPSCIKSQLSECGCITSKTYSFLRLRLKAICCCFSITLKQHLWISLLEIILWYL